MRELPSRVGQTLKLTSAATLYGIAPFVAGYALADAFDPKRTQNGAKTSQGFFNASTKTNPAINSKSTITVEKSVVGPRQ